jgi:hypothetical protein
MTDTVRTVAYLQKRVLYAAKEMPNKEDDNTVRRLWSTVNALECMFLALIVKDLHCIGDLNGLGSGQIIVDLVVGGLLPLRDLARRVHSCPEYNVTIW